MASKPEGIASRTRSRTLAAMQPVVSPVSQPRVKKTSRESKKSSKVTVENASAVKCSNGMLPPKKPEKIKEKSSKVVALIDLDSCPEVEIVPLLKRDSSTYKTEAAICSVCLDELRAICKPTTTVCGHIFCAECIGQALCKWNMCPVCKANITLESCIRLHFSVM